MPEHSINLNSDFNMPKVGERHPDMIGIRRVEKLIRDFMDEDRLKAACMMSYTSINAYLLIPLSYKKASGQWDEDKFRRYVYHAYMPEYIMQNSIKQTLGVTFKQDITIELPDRLMPLISNADRNGNSLQQMAKNVMMSLLVSGRHALLSDVDIKGNPFLSAYESECIPNWESNSDGYNYIELAEVSGDDSDDSVRRVFTLEGGVVVVKEYIYNKLMGWELIETTYPTLYNNEPLDYLPVAFMQETAVFRGMAKTLLKGFRQSANYFGMVDTLGSGKMIIYTDKSMSNLEGSHETGVLLGQGDKAELLQLRSDGASVVKSAMEDQFIDAQQQGIDIITAGANQAAADNLRLQAASKQIKVDELASNVSDLISEALRTSAKMVGSNEEEVVFHMNVELMKQPVDTKMLDELRKGIQEGLVLADDYVRALDEYGVISVDIDDDGNKKYSTYAAKASQEMKDKLDNLT